ncbi:MAG: excinuclease ABC subunit UvrC [Candidatus Porifericomitaceae bacterium WSBS_2022_MAG_OTU9]
MGKVDTNSENMAVAVAGHLRASVAAAPTSPGVYRLLDADGKILYVGKADNLKKRLRSYLLPASRLTIKTSRLMEHVRNIDTVLCDNPKEALILENNLIKSHQPRYNILFRDDKSYPFIRMDQSHDFPGLFFSRSSSNPKKQKQRYFGPYADSGSVRKALSLLQKLFRIRNCSDMFFRNRTRPCLQYHLQRCSAPCTSNIGKEDYAADLAQAVLFLEGRGGEVSSLLQMQMQDAAKSRNYELAGRCRDLIAGVRSVQQQYRIMRPGTQWDAVACCSDGVDVCVQVFSIRDGVNLGNRSYMQRRSSGVGDALPAVLAAFLARHYLAPEFGGSAVAEILLNHEPDGMQTLQQTISAHVGHKLSLRPDAIRGSRKKLLLSAVDNAMQYMQQRRSMMLHDPAHGADSVLAPLATALNIDGLETVECFDISHTGGTATTASCVVFGKGGPMRGSYRRFNIEGVVGGDDYAAMAQAVERRYRRQLQAGAKLPQLLLIDGGKGQVRAALDVLCMLGCSDKMRILGIAKAVGRKIGQEKLVNADGRSMKLPTDAAVWRPLLQLRDEAHRFALAGHRARRGKNISVLDAVPGVGAARRKLLLQHFGGLRGLRQASCSQLQAVPGIGQALAVLVHRQLHP